MNHNTQHRKHVSYSLHEDNLKVVFLDDNSRILDTLILAMPSNTAKVSVRVIDKKQYTSTSVDVST